MCGKVISKKEICNHPLITSKFNRNNRMMILYLLKQIKNYEYTINMATPDNTLIISYRGDKFSIEDLKQSTTGRKYVGGNGKNIIINSKVLYQYKDNINYWVVPVKEQYKNSPKEFEIRNISSLIDIEKYIEDTFEEDEFYAEGGTYEVIIEIITNIIYHTNIKTKGIITIWLLVNIVKFYVKEVIREITTKYNRVKLRVNQKN